MKKIPDKVCLTITDGNSKWKDIIYIRSDLWGTNPCIVSWSEHLKIRDEWYKKGYNAGLRKNKSECCCIIDDKEGVVLVCGEHEWWRNKELEPLKQAWKDASGMDEIDAVVNELAKKLEWDKE